MDLLNGFLAFIRDYSVETSLFFGFLSILIFCHLVYVISKEIAIYWKDYLHGYRIVILSAIVICIITIVPVLYYTILRYYGIENSVVRDLATFTGRVGPVALGVALEVLLYYKVKKK